MLDPDLTFVPGAAGLGAFWDPIRERLPSTWRSRTFDLPGLGPVPPHPHVASYSQLVDHVASKIPGPTALIGQSMGGYISLELTLRYPQLVTSLTLVVAAGGVDMARHGAHDWRPEARLEQPPRAEWTYAPTPDLSDQLHRIDIPVLLIWATRDAISPLGVAQQLAAQLPRARLLTFDTDDHWVARRFADETTRAIREFVVESGARQA
jgi:pimeloyl-ACP methyl ester carboxylesterase